MKRWFLSGAVIIVICMITISPYEFNLFFSGGSSSYVTQSLGHEVWLRVIQVGFGATTSNFYEVYVTDSPNVLNKNSMICALSKIDENKKFHAVWKSNKVIVSLPSIEEESLIRNHVPIQGHFVPIVLAQ